MSNNLEGWGVIDTPRDNGDGNSFADKESVFLKLTEGDHVVRFVGNPKVIYIAWLEMPNPETGQVQSRKFVVPKDQLARLNSMGLGKQVRKNYAVNVFERGNQEPMKVKILEKGQAIFSEVKAFADKNGINPGGEKAPNFSISVRIPKSNLGKRGTKYSIQPSFGPEFSMVPFTKEEIEFLKRTRLPKEEKDKFPVGQQGQIILDEFYDENREREKLIKALDLLSGINNTESIGSGFASSNSSLGEEISDDIF